MSSESPGNFEKQDMSNLHYPAKHNQTKEMLKRIRPHPGDNKCLPSPLLQRQPPTQSPSKTSKRNSSPSNDDAILPLPHHLLLLLLLLALVPYADADGFCSPLLCSCQVPPKSKLRVTLLVTLPYTLLVISLIILLVPDLFLLVIVKNPPRPCPKNQINKDALSSSR